MGHRGGADIGDAAVPTSRFVGREQELDRVTELLLARTPMVTLTGTGGIGKTRLAAEGVRRYHRATGTPVYWVRLARSAAQASTVYRCLDSPPFHSRVVGNVPSRISCLLRPRDLHSNICPQRLCTTMHVRLRNSAFQVDLFALSPGRLRRPHNGGRTSV